MMEEILAGLAVVAFAGCVVYVFYMFSEEIKDDGRY